MRLDVFGWNPWWESAFEQYGRAGFAPGRILAAHRGGFVVATEARECDAEPSGKLRLAAEAGADWPVTGDWVALSAAGGRIEAVVSRRTCFARKQAGQATRPQVLAANIDVALLVTGLDGDFNLRRIERYLFLASESGARPVVVLNKCDLCRDLEERMRQVEQLARGIPALAVSATEGSGLSALAAQMQAGETAVLLGSSGVGKSTIVNRLRGFESQATKPVREHDSRGRHTTTQRELIPLDLGWLLMDAPGIRELQLWGDSGAVEGTFSEIAEAATQCRFRDCRHQGEPGCRVAEALARGELDAARFANYQKMQRELDYVERCQDQRAEQAYKRRTRSMHRSMRKFYRESR